MTVEQLMMLVYAYGAAPDDKHAEPLKALKEAIEKLVADTNKANNLLKQWCNNVMTVEQVHALEQKTYKYLGELA